MRGKGITYDTGFSHAAANTRRLFDPETVRHEMRVIHDDLHCTSVRVTGGDPDRLEIAATYAAEAGLEVWFSPFTSDLTADDLLVLIADCADRAERIRRRGAEVVFLTGSELSIFTIGFLPGATLTDRLALLAEPHRLRPLLAPLSAHINEFLGKAVEQVRERFHGKVSYASLPFEGVDWTPFDVLATDAGYHSIEVADHYRDGIRTLVASGKPVAITEFGCTTYRGAADKGGRGDAIIEWHPDGRPSRLTAEYIRDEAEQANALRDTLDILTAEGVDSAFVNTFARYDLPHHTDPREDFDLASYGIVKVLENRYGTTYPTMTWEPKTAFTAVADYYREHDPHRNREPR
ncbi:hypothetical protein [Amycolatopsis sp. lyj-112]|uniref:hypothetical protein n=1 Tax=Amycolatopsis sp. lyj-112 TaxID=2789288 RepID=UPI0039783454